MVVRDKRSGAVIVEHEAAGTGIKRELTDAQRVEAKRLALSFDRLHFDGSAKFPAIKRNARLADDSGEMKV